ncbi:MAG: hypothetical protein Q4C13_06585 [Clostridia bacterium]|nr:hypothetical protein [Clostridia bacterium]
MKTLGKIGKNFIITIAAPVLVYLFFFALCNLTGHAGFGVGADFRTILYNTVYSGFIALAVSYNLTSGRFDFSVGSVLILSLIAGGSLAKQWDAGPMGLLLLVLAFGLVCGLVSGLVYITLRLPPMVTSLGVAMVFEAIAFKLNKSNGIRLIGRYDMLIWAQQPYSLILLACVLAILIYLLNYTKFGYNCRSLQTGQKNAVEVGVNEKRNAVACYVIAGGLMACAGALYISQYGYIAPQTGLGSSSFLMSAFLPMFIGNVLRKYSDRNIGVIMGAFVQACISSGLVKMGASSSLKTVFDGLVVLLFLVYVSNSYKFGLFRLYKEKKARALAETAGV